MLKTYLPEISDLAADTATIPSNNVNNLNITVPFNEFNQRFRHGRYSYSKFLEAVGAFRNMYSDMRPRLNLNDALMFDSSANSSFESTSGSAMIRTKPHAIFCSAHCEVSGALSCNKCIVKLHQFMSERNIDHLFANPRFKFNSVAVNKEKEVRNATENSDDTRKQRLNISIPSASNATDSDNEAED